MEIRNGNEITWDVAGEVEKERQNNNRNPKSSLIGTLIVIGSLLILAITNPNRKDHGVEMYREEGSGWGTLAIEQSTTYHNSILFSFAERGDYRSFGILGNVFVSRANEKKECVKSLRIYSGEKHTTDW